MNKRFNHGSNQPVQTTVIQINHIEDRKKIGTREILMFMPKIYADVSKTRLGDGVYARDVIPDVKEFVLRHNFFIDNNSNLRQLLWAEKIEANSTGVSDWSFLSFMKRCSEDPCPPCRVVLVVSTSFMNQKRKWS